MHQPNDGSIWEMALGFFAGIITLIVSNPKVILSSIGGAFFVAAFVSFASYVGKAAGMVVWRKIVKKYKEYKNRKP